MEPAEKNLPVIAIPCRLFASEQPEFHSIHGARQPYIESVIAAGGCPLLIPIACDDEVLTTLFGLCDGILLGGGEDICPTRYGEKPTDLLSSVDAQRDEVELTLAKWAIRDGKPVLGICRGCQIINVALGGSLYQDVPTAFEINHDCLKRGRTDAMEHLIHPIFIDPDSTLGVLLGTYDIQVNSLHHQSLRRIPAQLRAVAHSPDGVIEAIEGGADLKGFVLGVQCHAETLWQRSEPRWISIFDALIKACLARQPQTASTRRYAA